MRDHAPVQRLPLGTRASGNININPKLLNPIEVTGAPTSGVKAGVVYVVKCALGYKAGIMKNVPARMRAFGVLLATSYSIPLFAWFDDCHAAETRHREIFASKRINGELFDLTEQDIHQIRLRA